MKRAQIAQLVVSSDADDVLGATGLGSCVALVLLGETRTGRIVAGIAHVMLPEAREQAPRPRDPGKFANTAVPATVNELRRLGAERGTLCAVLVGGARMFDFTASRGRDIGDRNVRAIRHALDLAGIPIRAEDVGGSNGRTVQVAIGAGKVVVRRSRGTENELLDYRHPTHRTRRGMTAWHES